MSAAVYVDEAVSWAKALVVAEMQGARDHGPAMERVASKARVPFTVLWNLHYRRPKAISTESYAALGAYFGEQQRKYRAERLAIIAVTPLGKMLVRAADFVSGEGGRGEAEGTE